MLLAQALILAAEEEESSSIDILVPNVFELVAGIVAFAIVFFFVWRWALPMLQRTLEARQTAIREQLEAAEAAKLEAQSLLDDYKEQLANARAEANRIIEEARATGETVRADIVSKAEREAAAATRKAQEDIAAERERTATALRGEVAELSLSVAEKVVGSSLDSETSRQLIDRFIDDLGGISR